MREIAAPREATPARRARNPAARFALRWRIAQASTVTVTTDRRLSTRASEAPRLPPRGTLVVLLASAGLTLGLPHVPIARYLVWPLMLVSTLAHELGHGIAAVMSGGEFRRFEIYADGSGVAMTATHGRFESAFTSAGGLIGPAIAAMVLFAMARSERWARVGLGAVALGLVVAEILVVRNLFGFVFVGALAILLGAIVRFGNAWWARFSLVFLAVNLAVSVFTRGDYLFTDTAHTGAGTMPSDVARMAEALFLPYWFWGALCGAISVVALVAGLWLFLRAERREALREGA